MLEGIHSIRLPRIESILFRYPSMPRRRSGPALHRADAVRAAAIAVHALGGEDAGAVVRHGAAIGAASASVRAAAVIHVARDRALAADARQTVGAVVGGAAATKRNGAARALAG